MEDLARHILYLYNDKYVRKWASEKIQIAWRHHNYIRPFRFAYKCNRCWSTFHNRHKNYYCNPCDGHGEIVWTDIRRRDDANVNDIIHLKDMSSWRVIDIDTVISGALGVQHVQWIVYTAENEFGEIRSVDGRSVCDITRTAAVPISDEYAMLVSNA